MSTPVSRFTSPEFAPSPYVAVNSCEYQHFSVWSPAGGTSGTPRNHPTSRASSLLRDVDKIDSGESEELRAAHEEIERLRKEREEMEQEIQTLKKQRLEDQEKMNKLRKQQGASEQEMRNTTRKRRRLDSDDLSGHHVQELEIRPLHLQHAPDVEASQKEGSGSSPHMAQKVSSLSTIPPDIRPLEDSSPGKDNNDLDVLGRVEYEEESALTDHFGQMALDSEGHLRWIGGSSTMTLIETFRNETADKDATSEDSDQDADPSMLYFPTGLGFGKLKSLPSLHEMEYPERDLADRLVQAYFERFHFLLPVLDKPSFRRRYTILMDNGGRGELPGFVAVVFAVFAVAARFLDDPRIKSEHNMDPRGTAMIFYESAMTLYMVDHTFTQFAHVQCFALLSVFLAGLNRLPQAWLLIGQAIRTAQDLGMHRSPKPLKLSKVDKETRRKVWWCVYGLDRCLALQLGRPLGTDDNNVDVDLPIPVDDEDLPAYYNGILPETQEPSLMQGFVALTTLYRIADKILRHVYATDKLKDNISTDKATELQKVVDKLDEQLTRWCDDLHPNLRHSPTSPQMISMSAVLCSTFYAVVITLHRNFLPTRRNMMQYVGSTSVPKVVSASRSCIFLATSMNPAIPPSHHLALFVQSLFSSAIIILLVVMHATERGAADIAMSEVENCIRAMDVLQNTWPGVIQYKDLLLKLVQITKENLARGGQPRIGQLGLASRHSYSVSSSTLSTSERSIPSPPLPYASPTTRTFVEGPLTIQGDISSASTEHLSASPDTGSKGLVAQQGVFDPDAQPWSWPSDQNFFDKPAPGVRDSAFLDMASQNGAMITPFFNASTTAMNNGTGMDTIETTFERDYLSQYNYMDFLQSFVPIGPLQAGERESMWDGMPDVFNAEPRIFGSLGDYGELGN